MEHTIKTIKAVSLAQLIDELEHFKSEVDKGTGIIYLQTLRPADFLYLTRNHPEKDKIPAELVKFLERYLVEEEKESMYRYTMERIYHNPYLVQRLICLAGFYVEKKVFPYFWVDQLHRTEKHAAMLENV